MACSLQVMRHDRIDFISAYCDRWCERCAFTMRCAAFAAEAAIAMCGDDAAGLELAVGRPQPPWPGATRPAPPPWIAGLERAGMTPAEKADVERRERQRSARVEGTAIMTVAWAFTLVAHRWLSARYDTVAAGADAVVMEALAIALHDCTFITVKLSRALDGRDRFRHDPDEDDHPVQNDWNGTAKVALISVTRSDAAWRVLAEATGDQTPAILADQLAGLAREVEATFPQVHQFIRPGFDEPGV